MLYFKHSHYIRQDTANGATFVPGLSKHVVTSAREVAALVAFGDARRMVRVHCVLLPSKT